MLEEQRKKDLLDALKWIDPSECNYKTWLDIGMALKAEGMDISAWDEWSSQDKQPGRYDPSVIAEKWKSFRRQGITGGTIFHLAAAAGYRSRHPYSSGPDPEASRNDDNTEEDLQITEVMKRRLKKDLQPKHPENLIFEEPDSKWIPENEALRFLDAMFSKNELEYINWRANVRFNQAKAKYEPADRGELRKAADVMQMLRNGYSYVQVFGQFNPSAGIWIQCNPLDGKGIGSENIASFRHAVIECDSLPIEKQIQLVHQLQLPVTAMVFSGNRSVHAAVKIEAADAEEFRKRFRFVRSVCNAYGLEVDPSCSGYMMRLPGAMRSGHKQFLIETNTGKRNYQEWEQMIKKIMFDGKDPGSSGSVSGLPEGYWDSLEQMIPEADPLAAEVLKQQISHENDLKVITWDSIQKKDLEWIWYPRIPKGKITIIQGAPGVGKTMFVCQLIADLTTGKPFLGETDIYGIDGKPRKPMNVLYQIIEDDAEDTIAPRLIKAGADMKRVVSINESEHPLTFEDPQIKEVIIQNDISVAVFDPLVTYLGTKPDMNKANETRAVMQKVVNIAKETGCTFVIIAHTNKQSIEKSAMNRLSGSIDLLASVRSMLTLGTDPNDYSIKALALTKSNLSSGADTILFRITADDESAGLLEFVSYSDLSSDEIIQRAQKEKSSPQLEEAKGFLASMLSSKGYCRVLDLDKECKKAGISKSTLHRAKEKMKIISSKRRTAAGEQCWIWMYADVSVPDIV